MLDTGCAMDDGIPPRPSKLNTTSKNTDDTALWRRWADAAQQPAIDDALRSLYADLDAAVAARGPTCWQSGKCCHFGSYGHRLYVTALEIAWFLHSAQEKVHREQDGAGRSENVLPVLNNTGDNGADDASRCPYQVGTACTTHAIRPLGCRVFFCQSGTQQWQHELYERFLQDLRELHDQHDVPYRYLEWLAGLREAHMIRRFRR